MFKKKRGINLSYNRQGLIHFTCLDCKNQPAEIQQKILNLCMEVAGQDYGALYEIVTTEKSILSISLKYYINEKRLYKLRKTFYERW